MADFTLTEGKLSFGFSGVQYAEKYDDWAHYRNQFQSACGSAKAMDFAVIIRSILWLIEAKDYRQYRRTKPVDLPDEIAEKVRDTMAGLFSAKVHAVNPDEKNAAAAALKCNRIRIGVHLEQPKKSSKIFPKAVDPAKLLQKLKSRVGFADPHPKVFDMGSIPSDLGLTVTASVR